MIQIKGYMVFSIPAIVNIYEAITTDTKVDLVLVAVALITSALGSSLQIVHKNLYSEILIRKKEVVAIYVTGIVVGVVAYILGDLKDEILWTILIGIFGSYMSLDLFKYSKMAVVGVLKKLPDFFLDALRKYLNSKIETNEEDTDNNEPPMD